MKNRIFRRIASLRGTHPLAVVSVLSRVSRVNKLLQQLCSTEKTFAVFAFRAPHTASQICDFYAHPEF